MSSSDSRPNRGSSEEGASSNTRSLFGRPFLRVPVGELAILLAVGALYVALLTYLGLLRFENFYTTNWDLGINQQMLWTTGHGKLLYETGDAEFFDVRSFLEVHSTFVALLVVPLYALAPVPETLFILQGSVFFASAFPLYLLARKVIRSRLLVFCTVGLYLVSFGALAGLLYDFHWEAFVPLEFLSFYYLVISRRYRWSLLPLVAGICTLEVFPFFAGGVALFLLYEEFRKVGFRWRTALRTGETRIAVAMGVGMAVVYLLLREVQYVAIPYLVGSWNQTNAIVRGIGAPFSFGASWGSLEQSGVYWLLLLASLAFLPVLAPKQLILTVPWFVYSVFLTPSFSSYFGDQYALLALATLSVASVYGVGRLEGIEHATWPAVALVGLLLVSGATLLLTATTSSTYLLSDRMSFALFAVLAIPIVAAAGILWVLSRPPFVAPPAVAPRPPQRPWHRQGVQRGVVVTAVVCFVAFNLTMSPLNTTNFHATPFPGYWLAYGPNPASAQMEWIASFIPANAVVLASDFLFTYVANDANAWAAPWYPFSPGEPPIYFPFSGSNLPQYVLIDTADWGNVPMSVGNQLFNETTYGLVAYIYATSYPGTIYLFDLGYHGTTQVRYIEEPPSTLYLEPSELAVGGSGYYASNPFSRFGTVIDSNAYSLNPSYSQTCIWFGPYETIQPGTYNLTLSIEGSLFTGGHPGIPILTFDAGPEYLPQLFNVTLYSSDFTPLGWSDLTWQLTLPAPYPLMEFRGYLTYIDGTPNGYVTLNYIELSR